MIRRLALFCRPARRNAPCRAKAALHSQRHAVRRNRGDRDRRHRTHRGAAGRRGEHSPLRRQSHERCYPLITLKYDSPAVFEGGEPFADHIARQVKWGENEPAARVALRYTVTAEGETVAGAILESTDSRLQTPRAESLGRSSALEARHEERPPGRKRRRSAHPAARRQAAAGENLI